MEEEGERGKEKKENEGRKVKGGWRREEGKEAGKGEGKEGRKESSGTSH